MMVKGIAHVQVDNRTYILKEGQTIEIPKNTRHRVEAKKNRCVILEISYGIFDEEDIVRLEDDYKRKNPLPSQFRHK
jgi:mannose-6-phosphate isomerase